MNANELADQLKRFVEQIKPANNEHDDAVVKGLPNWFIEQMEEASDMLRQQSFRIKELDKRHADLMSTYVAYLGIEQKLNDRITELEKDLALKTRDRDVYRNFTLAYEERIAELEKDYTTVCLEVRDLCRENERINDRLDRYLRRQK